MSFSDCIANAVDGKEISKEEGERLKRDFERLKRARAKDAPAIAEAQAKKDLAEMLKAENAHRRRKAKLAANSIRRLAGDLSSFRDARGRKDIALAAAYKLENYDEAPFSSVAGRALAIAGEAQGKIADVLREFRRSAVGGDRFRHNAARLENVVKELFGEASGDARAAELAQAVERTFEWLRRRFNAAGGAIGKLEKYGLPQRHDARALRAAGRDTWKAYIRERLDPSRMRHPLTGKPVPADELDAILDEVFETITTGGWNKRDPKRQPFGLGALANQRAEHRFLVFKSARDWLDYQRDFGGGDPYSAITGHVSMMARDIAAMEILGPNPAGTVEWMKQAVMKEGAKAVAGQSALTPKTGRRARSYASEGTDAIELLWGSVRGDLEAPVNQFWAESLGATRSLISAAVLGSATLSSLSDVGTTLIARHFAGLPTSDAIPQLIKAFTPSEQHEAVAAGLILDAALHTFHARARFEGAFAAPEIASYISDRVLTYSGLLPWTQAGRHAFGLAFMAEAAKMADKSWEEMPRMFRATFERHGLSAREWDLLRKVKRHEKYDGTQILRPAEIAEQVDDKLATRYLEMIQAETEYAVPTGGHRARVAMLGRTRPGTLAGEILRSGFQFKSFGIAFAFLHGARIARLVASDATKNGWGPALTGSGAKYAGALLISTSIFGALSIQAKQIAAGRDPRDITTPAFWSAAMMQGGGFGIFGDFLFADVNRFGGGLTTTLAGPLVERLNQLRNLTIGNTLQFVSGEDTKLGKETVDFLRGNVPFSNIWYLRLAWERIALDQLQFLADPAANAAFKRKQKFWRKDFGQDFFWAPGALTPQRAPNLGAALGR